MRGHALRWRSGLVALMAVGLLLPSTAMAIPSTITVQGYLKTQAGLGASGTYALTLSLYDADSAGNTLWTETQVGVVVTNGLFNSTLGADDVNNPLMLATFRDNAQVWLGIKVEAGPGVPTPEAELPRTPLTTVGYAFVAMHAETAATALNVTCGSACISESELDFNVVTDSELAAALAAIPQIDSVDGLSGGTITSGVTVSGNLAATALTQNGNTVCDNSGNCGQMLATTTCQDGESLAYNATSGNWECTSGSANEPPDCEGRFQSLQYNATTGWACVDILATGPSGGQAQGFEIVDSWGFVWDGDEINSKTWADADADCTSRGGRLPTISELWRVSGAWKGDVGNAYQGNYLWTRTWWNKTAKTRVRLTDGAITNTAATSAAPYRCVWPNNTANHFTGNHCMGEPGSECYDHPGTPDGKMHMDSFERPPVSYVAANDECTFYHAHLAHQRDYAEAVLSGLGNGTYNWMWTVDNHRYDIVSIVRWSGSDPNGYTDWANNYQTWAGRTGGPYRFRCIGASYDAGSYPATLSDEYEHTRTYIKGIEASTASVNRQTATDACFTQGGHISSPRDIIELTRDGMGAGPGTGGSDYIWLSDWTRYDIAQVTRWGGVDTSYTSHHSEYETWATVNTGTTYQYRCTFYPINADYEHPANANCAGGFPCHQIENGEFKGAYDPIDRAAVTYTAAVSACLAVGGRLPKAHELKEAIRAGLPNGSNLWLWTADGSGDNSNGYSYAEIFRWNGVNANFGGIYSGDATWSGKGSQTRNFRCMWNNELH